MTRYFTYKTQSNAPGSFPYCWKYQDGFIYVIRNGDNGFAWELSSLSLNNILGIVTLQETSFDFIPDIVKELEEKEFQLNSFSKVEGVLL